MIHRYLAMAVGALILALNVVLWRARKALERAPLWALAALAWVVVQGLFGKYTVTLRLYPAVVTAHLLGGMVLLALLVAQAAVAAALAGVGVPRELAARRCWRCSRCRSRSVAGSAATTPCSLAAAFRNATASGGPRPTMHRASRCCASWGAQVQTATWTSRRWSRFRWCIARSHVLVSVAVIALSIRLWRSASKRSARRDLVAVAARRAGAQRLEQRAARLAAAGGAVAHRGRRRAGGRADVAGHAVAERRAAASHPAAEAAWQHRRA